MPVARASAGAHASVDAIHFSVCRVTSGPRARARAPTTACFPQYAPITDGFTLDDSTAQYKYTGGQYPNSWGGHFTVNTCNGG